MSDVRNAQIVGRLRISGEASQLRTESREVVSRWEIGDVSLGRHVVEVDCRAQARTWVKVYDKSLGWPGECFERFPTFFKDSKAGFFDL